MQHKCMQSQKMDLGYKHSFYTKLHNIPFSED